MFLFVCALSGAAALAYQIIWSKLSAVSIGHEFPATAAVVSAFMAGMAAGNLLAPILLRSRISPARLYAFCELLIGCWGALSPLLIINMGQVVSHWVGIDSSPQRQYLAAFLCPLIILFPATLAIGATFPILEAWGASTAVSRHPVHFVYAINVFGGVAGLFIAAFVILPAAGLTAAALSFALVNLICAILAWSQRSAVTPVSEPVSPRPQSPTRLPTLIVTGFLGIGFEIAGVRVLSQVIENTVYSFTVVLAAYLCATAAGAWGLIRLDSRREVHTSALLQAASFAVVFAAVTILFLRPLYDYFRDWFGDSRLGVAAAEFAIALVFLALPCTVMGALFARLVEEAKKFTNVGYAVAANTLGAAMAPPLMSLLILPRCEIKWALALISTCYLLLARPAGLARWAATALPFAALALLPHLRIIDLPTGSRAIFFREGVMSTVAVVEDARGHRVLRVNNRLQMGGTAAAPAEHRQAFLPLLLHPSPRRALFLGVGTGITLGAAALFSSTDIEGIELVPEIVQAIPQFKAANYDVVRRTNVHLRVGDARRFVRETTIEYDVIVADVFHPGQDGAGTLYTAEHYLAIRKRLARQGVLCQWIPLHQVDLKSLRVMIRTFQSVFPKAQAWLLHFNVDIPVLGLVSEVRDPAELSRAFNHRLGSPDLGPALRELSLSDPLRLFGHFVAGPHSLEMMTLNSAVNTDDSQVITFAAPDYVVRRNAAPAATLLALLAELPAIDPELSRLTRSGVAELPDYLKGRNVYLAALVEQAAGRSDSAIEGFIQSAELSSEFTAGYAQVLTLASLVAKQHPDRARQLLQRLIKAQPDRPVARQFLDRLERPAVP